MRGLSFSNWNVASAAGPAAVPDVVPHDSKVARPVSPPASHDDIFSPSVTGAVRTVVFIFTTRPTLSDLVTMNETLFQD
jgi:hypothetical protein